MARTRSLEVWHIPKRRNVHQIIGAIEILSQEKFNGKSWTSGKKEMFNTELGKQGLTESGGPLALSGRRTLEALLKYLGFIYVDHSTTPETINVTNAGLELIKKHGSVIGKRKNLKIVQEHGEEILTSPLVQTQMTKLQITNPVIKEDCINILLFPFRITLRLLIDLGELTKEEIGYILFAMKREDEYNLISEKIRTFRSLPQERKNAEIDAFKNTQIGNLTLVQAPTATYYMGLCVGTGICERRNDSLFIKFDKIEEAKSIIEKFKNVEAFDFGDNLRLWIDYFGNIGRWLPPSLVKISNKSKGHLFIRVMDSSDVEVETGIISEQQPEVSIPLFINEIYIFQFFDFKNAKKVFEKAIRVDSDSILFDVKTQSTNPETWSFDEIASKIKDLITSGEYDVEYQRHVENVKQITGRNVFNVAQLRGGRLEYLFYKLLTILQENGEIEEVIWHGRIDDFGIAYPGLGGKEGYPDIHFYLDDYLVALELTTIRANANQWSAEAASVHDHIRNLLRNTTLNRKPVGIFSAPIIGDRTKNMFIHISTKENIPHITLSIEKLIETLEEGKSGILDLFRE